MFDTRSGEGMKEEGESRERTLASGMKEEGEGRERSSRP
jgi:hypothetical protein